MPDPRRAEALGARLPPLLVAAERVAATVAQGVHGRRRTGQGDSFWQYRPFLPGDAAGRIDWRQTAKSGRAFVRETEWEAAQTVCLWRDASASMQWRSAPALPHKAERAELLLLALASLLLRGGERVRLLGGEGDAPARAVQGRAALDGLAQALACTAGTGPRAGPEAGSRADSRTRHGVPPASAVPRHARIVLIGDFLAPLPELRGALAGLAGGPVAGHVLQLLDPAEALLPYTGRVRFRGLEREADALVPRVEGVRTAYAAALAEQQAGLAAICAAAGWGFSTHRTDHPPEQALLGLYTALSAR